MGLGYNLYFSQVWGRREGCQETIRIIPTYMFLLFLFREASSHSVRSVPLICRENRDTVLSGYSGHKAPAACKQPSDPQCAVSGRAQIKQLASSCFVGRIRGTVVTGNRGSRQTPWLAGEQGSRQTFLLCDLAGHCLFMILHTSVSTTKILMASSGLRV